jgi:predicted ABC-type ATPase
MNEETEDKQLILVAGVTGSGRSTFSRLFKNSFLRSLPRLSINEGLATLKSFYALSTLGDLEEISLLNKAKILGYKITIYYLFTGRLLSIQRAKLREIVTGEKCDENNSKRWYESSYKGLASCFDIADFVFFLKNQKDLLFVAAYQPSTTPKERYLASLQKMRDEVDRIS